MPPPPRLGRHRAARAARARRCEATPGLGTLRGERVRELRRREAPSVLCAAPHLCSSLQAADFRGRVVLDARLPRREGAKGGCGTGAEPTGHRAAFEWQRHSRCPGRDAAQSPSARAAAPSLSPPSPRSGQAAPLPCAGVWRPPSAPPRRPEGAQGTAPCLPRTDFRSREHRLAVSRAADQYGGRGGN